MLPGLDAYGPPPPPPGGDLTSEEWIALAVDVIIREVWRRGSLTADDVRPLLPVPGGTGWPGQAFAEAAKEGYIRRTGEYVASTAPARHHGANAVWVPGDRRPGAAK